MGYGQRVATGWGLLLRGRNRNGPCGSCCASAGDLGVRQDDSFESKSGTWYINGVGGGVCGRDVRAQGARRDTSAKESKPQNP